MSRPLWLGVGAGAVALAALRAERRYAAAVAADPCAAELSPVDPVEARRVAVDGAELHVEVHGRADGPTVVLVHGWTCTAGFWTRQLRALADEVRVVTYDLRGHGRSTGEPASFGPDALAGDLQAVLDATLPEGERALLVGHSMGAMTIAAWAGRHPDEVPRRASAAVLLSTGVHRLSLDSAFLPLPARYAVHQGLLQATLLGSAAPLVGPLSLHSRGTRWLAFSPSASPAVVDRGTRDQRAMRPAARAAWARAMGDLDLRHDLASLTVPTTVVVGERDRLTPPVYAERLAALLPDCVELVRLPDVGHMTPLEAPDEVVELVRSALTERIAA